MDLLRRIRWGNVARAAAAVAALALVVAWPRVRADPPALPPEPVLAGAPQPQRKPAQAPPDAPAPAVEPGAEFGPVPVPAARRRARRLGDPRRPARRHRGRGTGSSDGRRSARTRRVRRPGRSRSRRHARSPRGPDSRRRSRTAPASARGGRPPAPGAPRASGPRPAPAPPPVHPPPPSGPSEGARTASPPAFPSAAEFGFE